MSFSEETKRTQLESFEYNKLNRSKFEINFAVEQHTGRVEVLDEKMANAQSSNVSKIPSPGFTRKKLTPLYEKTKLLRTVLERQVTQKLEPRDTFRVPKSTLTSNKQLNFSNLTESKGQSSREQSDSTLEILRSEEMDLGSFRISGEKGTGLRSASNLSDGILTDAQMVSNSFELSNSKIDMDYLLNRLQDQIIRHNTLLDASEKFPKSPSIENLVKQCMKGTNALNNLKERVTCYKLAKQQKRSSTRKSLPNASLLHEMPNIIQNTLNCAKELYQLSEDLIQLSSSFDQSLMNRSSTASQSIKDTTERLLEIEQMWKNMPSPDAEEGSSLGLLHESDMHDTGDFLNDDTSQSLNGIFEQLNHSLEEVLKTPNTHSLTHLKSHLIECQKLLSNITLNHSQLNDESMPSLADSREVPEVPLLNVVADELSKSWKSEIEAFLEIWKSPEKERFLQMSQQTIEDLSFLSQETNHMLDTMKMSAYVKQVEPSRKKHLIDRLNMLRSSEATVQRPNYTSIIMKDYIDEDDLCAEQECCSKVESSKRTVQFTSNIDGVTALPVQSSTSIPKQGERMELVETRLQTLLTEMNKFKQNYLNPENSQEERHQDTKIEHKIDELMAMITGIVHALKAN